MDKNTNLNLYVCKIEYADIKTILRMREGTLPTRIKIDFTSGNDFISIYSTPGKMVFAEPTTKTNAGYSYNQKLNGFYPGDEEQNNSDLNNLTKNSFVVRFTYNNGIQKLIGSLVNPCSFFSTYDTSKKGSDFSFECTSNEPSYIYES